MPDLPFVLCIPWLLVGQSAKGVQHRFAKRRERSLCYGIAVVVDVLLPHMDKLFLGQATFLLQPAGLVMHLPVELSLGRWFFLIFIEIESCSSHGLALAQWLKLYASLP